MLEAIKKQNYKQTQDCLTCSNLKRDKHLYKWLQSTIIYYGCSMGKMTHDARMFLPYGRFNGFLNKIRRDGCNGHSNISISNLKPEVGSVE